MKLLGVDQLVGTAMSSSSNGIRERKIKELRRMFKPIMDRGGAMAWKTATIAVQVAAINIPNEAELSPEQLVLSIVPRRVQDLIHEGSRGAWFTIAYPPVRTLQYVLFHLFHRKNRP
eukprot:SAG11_NODE_39_length_21630_cov_11.188658_2_plen_117_part_00